jgi:hypothetical protein
MTDIPLFLQKTIAESPFNYTRADKAKAEFVEKLNEYQKLSVSEERLKIKSILLEHAKEYDSLRVNNFVAEVFAKIGV